MVGLGVAGVVGTVAAGRGADRPSDPGRTQPGAVRQLRARPPGARALPVRHRLRPVPLPGLCPPATIHHLDTFPDTDRPATSGAARPSPPAELTPRPQGQPVRVSPWRRRPHPAGTVTPVSPLTAPPAQNRARPSTTQAPATPGSARWALDIGGRLRRDRIGRTAAFTLMGGADTESLAARSVLIRNDLPSPGYSADCQGAVRHGRGEAHP